LIGTGPWLLQISAMRLPTLFAILALSFVVPGFPSAYAASSPDVHVFSGEVTAVNPAAKTVTIKSGGKSFVFHVTPETKLTSYYGHAAFEKIRPGEGATVVMKLGPGNIGIAISIHTVPSSLGARLTSYYSAKTIDGDTVHGNAVGNYVAYEPPNDEWSTSLEYRRHSGAMFLLLVNRDGTVSEVRPLATLGYSELDERAIRYFKRWKFRPNSVTEVRMPMVYTYHQR
jgi:TonB family protein